MGGCQIEIAAGNDQIRMRHRTKREDDHKGNQTLHSHLFLLVDFGTTLPVSLVYTKSPLPGTEVESESSTASGFRTDGYGAAMLAHEFADYR